MKTHFVTGGTGYLGRELIKRLLSRGDKIYVLVRDYESSSKKKIVEDIFGRNKMLIIVSGNITRKNLGIKTSILKDLRKDEIHFVWHLAANLSFSSKITYSQKYKTNVTGTKNVVEFANRLHSRLCHCSTAHVGGDAMKFSESMFDVGQKFRNDYEKTKYLAEKVVRKYSKIPYIIFRPSLIIGKPTVEKASCTFSVYRYGYLLYLLKIWLFKSLNVLGSKNPKKIYLPFIILPYPVGININMVNIDYVVKSFINIALSKSAFNRTYHLTHTKPPSYIFLSKNIFDELSILGIKYVGVSPNNFRLFINFVHFIAVPWRKYINSAKYYLPYMSYNQIFVREDTNKYNAKPKIFTKKLFSKIIKEANSDIYPKTNI